ncbi:MAG: cytochrome b, partial [Planctomyces sp.]
MNALLSWLDNRVGVKSLVHEALYERVPGGARWRYVWGSTLVFTFAVQVITGFMLWSAYSPSTRTAWESVYYIQHEMFLGYVIRGLHHYSAQAMVVLMAIHLMQVVIDGAYKAPREINFWLGIVLMMIVLGLSLTGYLLPWDQKGYYATQVTTNIMSATPVVGAEVQILAQGGRDYGHLTLTRFFAMHAGILPAMLVGFLALHIYVFRRHGLTVHDPKHAPDTTFWPDQVLKDAVACLAVLATVLILAVLRPAELSAPADPAVKFDAARPEWYFLFLFRFLRFHAVEALGLTFG